MNENNEHNSGKITPYRATGNLNTAINNPSVNINDTMNVNIQSMATNEMNTENKKNYNNYNNNEYDNSIKIDASVEAPTNVNNQISYDVNKQSSNLNNYTQNNISQQNSNHKSNYVKKTYVTTDNKPKKKKTMKLNLGQEFKIALLIIVILLVFIFLLPVISDLFRGY